MSQVQCAPLHIIFDIKLQDMRHKARLVVEGNVVDSLSYNTTSATVYDLSVRLLMLISTQNALGLMIGDISNALPTSPNMKKI